METLARELRYTVRQLRLSPVFTVTAIVTLALGIGGTTAIFSLVNAVLLRSLPVADPSRLYRIGEGNECCIEGALQSRWGMFTYPFYERLKNASPQFEQLAAFQAGPSRSSVRRANYDKLAKPLRSELVTGNYFSTFGLRAFAGRLFTPQDDQPSSTPVAVLSYRAWQSEYAGDAGVIGSNFVVEGHPFVVIGISPPGFFGDTLRSDPPEIWLPLQQEPLLQGTGSLLHQSLASWLRVVGRLKPGANTQGLSSEYTMMLRDWLVTGAGFPAAWIPEIKRQLPKQQVEVVPAGSGVAEMKEDYGRSLQILSAVCGLVLLIACANVANLLLARAIARRSQTAVRLAIGASTLGIVGQSLVESIVLAIAGGLAGIFVAIGADHLLISLAFHNARFVPIDASPSAPVLAFAFGLSFITALLFGTAPAWFATRTKPVEALRGANRSTQDRSSVWRKGLLIAQATLSVVLIAGAGMLARSLNKVETQRFGFRVKDAVSVSLNAPPATYSFEKLNSIYRSLQERLGRIPGIRSVALALYSPLTDNWGELVMVDGHPMPKLSEDAGASWDRVSPNFFSTIGEPLLRGRFFDERDNQHSEPVAVVNQAFVRRFFPHENPLGKRFGIDLPELARTFQIVGVVGDAKFSEPEKPPRAMFFLPLAQRVPYSNDLMNAAELRSHFIGSVMLETTLSAGSLEPALKSAFPDVDPNLTIIKVRTMEEQVAMRFDQERAVADLAGLFGVVALLLAAVGLYGVTAYNVVQRTSEIGVRVALGADQGRVVRLILRGAFGKAAAGLALGIPLSIAAGRLISSQLYEVSNWDPVALCAAIAALGISSLLAAILPAMRAAVIEPMRALRVE
jgi:predicted permease